MPYDPLQDVKSVIRHAECETRRLHHACLDTPHILLGVWRRREFGKIALAAFGVRERALRTAASRHIAAVPPDPPAPAAPQFGQTLPLTARAAHLLQAVAEFADQHERDAVFETDLLYVGAGAPEYGLVPILADLAVEVQQLRWELRPSDAPQYGTPHLDAFFKSYLRGPLGWWRRLFSYHYSDARIPRRSVEPRPTDPRMLLLNLADQTLRREESEFTISAADFPAWVNDEVRQTPGFDPQAGFRGVLDLLTEHKYSFRFGGLVHDWPDPATCRGGKVFGRKEGEIIHIRVADRRTHAIAPAQDDPCLLVYDIAETVRQHGKWPETITRAQLRDYLPAQLVQHPEFDADACFDALIAQLDQPQDWKRLAGPICCCGRPPLWVYTDGRQIHVARWLAPWTQRQLLRSGRRKRDATLRTD